MTPKAPEPGPGADVGHGPAGSTHDLSIDPGRGVVTKRFRSWARNEPAREWTALCLLAGSAPGLAAQPLSADLDSHPPAITMSAAR